MENSQLKSGLRDMDKEIAKLDREHTKATVELETRTANFQKVVDSLQ